SGWGARSGRQCALHVRTNGVYLRLCERVVVHVTLRQPHTSNVHARGRQHAGCAVARVRTVDDLRAAAADVEDTDGGRRGDPGERALEGEPRLFTAVDDAGARSQSAGRALQELRSVGGVASGAGTHGVNRGRAGAAERLGVVAQDLHRALYGVVVEPS